MAEVAAGAGSRIAPGQRTLLLGVATLVCALGDGAIIATYEGPALVPKRFLAVLVVKVVLLVLAVVSYVRGVDGDRQRGRNLVGFVLAVSALPVTGLLLLITYTVLNEVFHLYW